MHFYELWNSHWQVVRKTLAQKKAFFVKGRGSITLAFNFPYKNLLLATRKGLKYLFNMCNNLDHN